MTKRKLSRKERNEVRCIFEDQRASGRCKIVKRLSLEADELTRDVGAEIKSVEKSLSKLQAEQSRILKDAHLISFDKVQNRGYCANYVLHPDLDKYDDETNRLLVELLTEEEVPIDVKTILSRVLE